MSTIPSSSETLGITTNRSPFEPRNIAAYAAGVVIWNSKFYSARDILPEPFDVADHFSNTMMTLPLAAPAALVVWASANASASKAYRQPIAEADQSFTRRKRFALAATVGTAVVANTFAETIGYGGGNTADPIDFAYGIMGGLAAYALVKPRRLSADDVQSIHASEEYNQNPEEYAELDKLIGHTPPPKPKTNSHNSRRRRKKNRSKKK